MSGLKAADIHQRLGATWPNVLAQLGIAESALRNKHGPCPACGGKDRFRFDNKRGRGDFICNQCGGGDGFKLLQNVHHWSFAQARRAVMETAELTEYHSASIAAAPRSAPQAAETVARPSGRVLRIRRERCAVSACDGAMAYLASRVLWPLPEGCVLWAHTGVDYFKDGRRVGRYPVIVADIVDVTGSLATVHVTYLENGRKLETHSPRKLLSPLTGREGCAVRLMPTGKTLGIAEGIETALSGSQIDGIPVWAALNTSLLARFEPPPSVERLVIFADRDTPGLEAAGALMQRLQGRVPFELRLPRSPYKDFNEQLCARKSAEGSGEHAV